MNFVKPCFCFFLVLVPSFLLAQTWESRTPCPSRTSSASVTPSASVSPVASSSASASPTPQSSCTPQSGNAFTAKVGGYLCYNDGSRSILLGLSDSSSCKNVGGNCAVEIDNACNSASLALLESQRLRGDGNAPNCPSGCEAGAVSTVLEKTTDKKTGKETSCSAKDVRDCREL